MNILFIMTMSFSPFKGGVQNVTWKLGKHFTEHGMNVSYLSMAGEGHMEPEYGKLYYNAANESTSSNMEGYIHGVLNEVRPDIVINQGPYERELQIILSGAKDKYGYKLVGCLHNSLYSFKSNAKDKVREQLSGIKQKLAVSRPGMAAVHTYHYLKHRRDLKRILDSHDVFVLLTPSNREELEHFVGGYKSEKVRAIPNSIPSVHPYGKKKKKLLYVGRLNITQKRADLLLPVWRELHEKLTDWEFVIVGDGPEKEKIDRTIRELNLPRVTTTGRQNPESYYSEASIFVMPSAYEGFPLVILESQSHGVVPVAFNSYLALPWIVNDGKDALLEVPFNVNGMAKKIAELVADRDRLEAMGRAAIRNAEKFTVDRVGEQWFGFFDEMLQHERTK